MTTMQIIEPNGSVVTVTHDTVTSSVATPADLNAAADEAVCRAFLDYYLSDEVAGPIFKAWCDVMLNAIVTKIGGASQDRIIGITPAQ